MTSTGKADKSLKFRLHEGTWLGQFQAMASPCEVLIDGGDEALARRLAGQVAQEAWRIERKFSRYRSDNILHRINTANGRAVKVDGETARLLNYADQCYRLSEGRFDISSGVLRRAWRFDGSDKVPESLAIEQLMPLLGWSKVAWDGRKLQLAAGMEIDFGGIGKEYAVDRSFERIQADSGSPFLLNFGGDLRCSGPRANGAPWRIGIEHVEGGAPARELELFSGAIATSGDARKFLCKDGVRYSHVLDPRSGWSVPQAARSVTVAGDNCSEAGFLATLALLQGEGAQAFLQGSGMKYWLQL
ncbi:MAG: FAD:protein FMN transferase [Oceanococcus sp.]